MSQTGRLRNQQVARAKIASVEGYRSEEYFRKFNDKKSDSLLTSIAISVATIAEIMIERLHNERAQHNEAVDHTEGEAK